MANDRSTSPGSDEGRLRPSSEALDPSQVYGQNADLIYGIVRWFLQEPFATEKVIMIAQELASAIPRAGYRRYSTLVCLNTVFTQLRADPKVKIPRIQHDPALLNDLGFDEAFCLLMRDLYELSCFDIGAIIGISEGSVRTRLERCRAKVFSKKTGVAQSGILKPAPSTGTHHICIRAHEVIEDWDNKGARLGQFNVPANVSKAVGSCEKCEDVLHRRLLSISYFQDLPPHSTPENLKTFPVSPLFVKEGKRILFNWSAAPWYVKALFEGLLATTLVLGVVLSIPRIKSLYEFWLERRLDLYSLAELAGGGTHNDFLSESAPNPAPEQAGNEAKPAESEAAAVGTESKTARGSVKPETEFIGRGSESATSDRVYRILIKTDSPEALKERVLKSLLAVHFVAADEDSSTGAELPGGIMFDVFIPLQSYEQIKNELTQLGDEKPKLIITRAKERGMPGKARLKIWLQRI